MSAENNVAKLEEILERVKLNRIRLANAREEAQKVAVAPAEPEAVLPPPAEPAPVVAEPEPVVAEPEPEPETRTFEAPVTSSGPVASMEGEIQTGAWTLDAILRRAHKLGA